MDNNIHPNELCHYGIKGQRWGVRRYQNPDGTLTSAGKKRYNKEMKEIERDKKKLAKEKQELSNRKKTQAKIEKLERLKAKVKTERDAVRAENKRLKDAEKQKKNTAKEYERQEREKREQEKQAKEREKEAAAKQAKLEKEREKALKSSDPKELYEKRHLLTTEELNERMTRITTEEKLASMVPKEVKKGGKYYIDKLVGAYKTVDDIYGTFQKSNLSKLFKKDQKKFSVDEYFKGWENADPTKIKELSQYSENFGKVSKFMSDHAKGATSSLNKDLGDLGKDVAKTVAEGYAHAKYKEEQKAIKKAKKEAEKAAKKAEKEGKEEPINETHEGTVVGEGTSKSDLARGSSWVSDDWDVKTHTPSDVKRGQAYLDQLSYNEEEYFRRFLK